MLSTKTVFEEILDNDEASRLFCSDVAASTPCWPGTAQTTRRTTSSSTPTGYDH